MLTKLGMHIVLLAGTLPLSSPVLETLQFEIDVLMVT